MSNNNAHRDRSGFYLKAYSPVPGMYTIHHVAGDESLPRSVRDRLVTKDSWESILALAGTTRPSTAALTPFRRSLWINVALYLGLAIAGLATAAMAFVGVN